MADLIDRQALLKEICSECETVWYNEYNHCPNCGCKMDLEG